MYDYAYRVSVCVSCAVQSETGYGLCGRIRVVFARSYRGLMSLTCCFVLVRLISLD